MSDVSLLCVGDGDLVWLRDGVELLEGGYVSLTAEGRLVLTSISITETGPYECNNGSHSEFITISLTSKLDIQLTSPSISLLVTSTNRHCGWGVFDHVREPHYFKFHMCMSSHNVYC